MAKISDEVIESVEKGLEELRTLRDEVRVKLHLAGMEAKNRWTELEPTIHDAESKARELGEKARTSVAEAVKAVRVFATSLANQVSHSSR